MSGPDPTDRQAYLEEQIAKQKRGEPIDVDWVRSELERVRQEQTKHIADTQRNLRWLVIGSTALLFVLWIQNGGTRSTGGMIALALIVIGALAAYRFRAKR